MWLYRCDNKKCRKFRKVVRSRRGPAKKDAPFCRGCKRRLFLGVTEEMLGVKLKLPGQETSRLK